MLSDDQPFKPTPKTSTNLEDARNRVEAAATTKTCKHEFENASFYGGPLDFLVCKHCGASGEED